MRPEGLEWLKIRWLLPGWPAAVELDRDLLSRLRATEVRAKDGVVHQSYGLPVNDLGRFALHEGAGKHDLFCPECAGEILGDSLEQ